MTARRVWAAVPYKGPVGSKRRLASLLDEDERARLSLAMLGVVLDALLAIEAIEHVLLLTPWERGLPARPGDGPYHSEPVYGPGINHLGGTQSWGGQDGRAPRENTVGRLTVVKEARKPGGHTGHDNLNGALRQAQAVARDGGADALLIVPADLPLITEASVAALLAAASEFGIVLAPDRAADGTNALLLAPPTAIEPSFGLASFVRHRQLTQDAGLRDVLVRRPDLALDLDTPDDVAALLASGRDSAAVRLLRRLDVAQRLEALASAQARSTTI